MKPVDTHVLPLDVPATPAAKENDGAANDPKTSDARSRAGQFDALLAKAADHDAAAGKRTLDAAQPAVTKTPEPGYALPSQGRSIHSSITRSVRPVDKRVEALLQTPTTAASAQVVDASSTPTGAPGKAPTEAAVAATAELDDPAEQDDDPQALQAVLSQVASAVAQIVVPRTPDANTQVGAAVAVSAQESLGAVSVSADKGKEAAALNVPATAGGVAPQTVAPLMVAPRPRTASPLTQTAAEIPAAKAKTTGTSTQATPDAGAAKGQQVSLATPAALSQSSATPAADSPAATAATPAAPAADGSDKVAPAAKGPGKAAAAAPLSGAQGEVAASTVGPRGAVQVATLPLDAAETLPSARVMTARDPRATGKDDGAPVDDRIRGFTRGALGGPVSAYVGRAQANAEAQSQGNGDSKHAEQLDEQADHDSKVDASSVAGVTAMTLPDPTVNAQVNTPQLEAPRVDVPSPQPAAPLPTPAAPLAQVEFAARAQGSQNEAASISIHHPDLGPIQLEVHRDHGRVEVHALAESVHAEAVLRANESGIRQGVQQSGMTFSALRVRVRGEEQNTARQAQPRRRRANERE